MLPSIVMGCWNVSLKTGSDSLSPPGGCCVVSDIQVYGQMQRNYVEEKLAHSFCSTCKRNVILVSKWHRVSVYLNVLGSDLPNSKPSCFIAQQLLLNIDYVILEILLQFLWVWWTFVVFDKAANPVSVCVSCLPCLLDGHTFWFLYANLCW